VPGLTLAPGFAAELGLALPGSAKGLVELPVAYDGLLCEEAGEVDAAALVEEPERAALVLAPELSAGFLFCEESDGYDAAGV
jgi:hypothetical protein